MTVCNCMACGRFYVPTFPDDGWCSGGCYVDWKKDKDRRMPQADGRIRILYERTTKETP